MDAEIYEIDDAKKAEKKEFDFHANAKKTIVFVVMLGVGWVIERTYDSVRERRENANNADIIDIIE